MASSEIVSLHSYRRELRGAALEPAQRLEQLDQFVPAQGCHDGAAVKAKLDQTFGRQLLKGFAQRCPRHSERIGQVGFEQLLPGCKIAAHDQLAKPRRGLLIQAGARHPQLPSLQRRCCATRLGRDFSLDLGNDRFDAVHEDEDL
jgi:hypothetical protein